MSPRTTKPVMDCVSFCRALGDSTRQEILEVLQKKGAMRVNEIVAAFNRSSQPTISHHLKILRQEGLVSTRRDGKEIYYALNTENVEECCGTLWAKFVPTKSLALFRKPRRERA